MSTRDRAHAAGGSSFATSISNCSGFTTRLSAESEQTRNTGLWTRWSERNAGACPFGIVLRSAIPHVSWNRRIPRGSMPPPISRPASPFTSRRTQW